MKQTILKTHIILFAAFCVLVRSGGIKAADPMVESPEQYIKISDWSFYTAFRTAIIHHVTIQNTSDISYKDIKVRVWYYSTAPSNYGTLVGQETGVLHLMLPPKSTKTYLEGGAILGAGSSLFYADNLEVLGAVPILNQ